MKQYRTRLTILILLTYLVLSGLLFISYYMLSNNYLNDKAEENIFFISDTVKTHVNINLQDDYLKFIRDFKENTMPIMDFIRMICENWNHGSMGYHLSRKYKGKYKFELHTLGWSGNEAIIREITNNIYLTHIYMKYYQWRTGGHYYFEVPVR